MNKQPTIMLVGGGTGGHIFPLLNLAKKLLSGDSQVHLVVNDSPLDRQLVKDYFSQLKGLKFYYLKTAKWHYHFTLKNLITPFQILASLWQARKLLAQVKPDKVFFKGGFVGFPLAINLKFWTPVKTSVYLHESDISPGKITDFLEKISDQTFSNFGVSPTRLFYWPENLQVSAPNNKTKKILVFGGSQGAQFINQLVVDNIAELTKRYQVTLVAGPKNRVIQKLQETKNFRVVDFMPPEQMVKSMVESDLVICRSGASIFQVAASLTPSLLIPLPTSARDHQADNAKHFAHNRWGICLPQNDEALGLLLPTIEKALKDEKIKNSLAKASLQDQSGEIAKILLA